jgi:hypothetical protein
VGVFVLEVVVAAAVLIGIAVVASHDFGGLDDEPGDVPDLGLPTDRPVRSDDLDRLHLRVVTGLWGAVRGYRFADVDEAMGRVQDTLRAWEAERAGSADADRTGGSRPSPAP